MILLINNLDIDKNFKCTIIHLKKLKPWNKRVFDGVINKPPYYGLNCRGFDSLHHRFFPLLMLQKFINGATKRKMDSGLNPPSTSILQGGKQKWWTDGSSLNPFWQWPARKICYRFEQSDFEVALLKWLWLWLYLNKTWVSYWIDYLIGNTRKIRRSRKMAIMILHCEPVVLYSPKKI